MSRAAQVISPPATAWPMVCRRCPVRGFCLSGAVERREPYGVWGGEIFQRGTVTAQKKARGRPRAEVGCGA